MSGCGFCKGRPVLNAAAWVSLDAPKYAPCPRCGREWTEAELELELERAERQAAHDDGARIAREHMRRGVVE
jgi:hypothetical protein